MKKRELLVFAGQSNMMGAAVYPPKIPVNCRDSFEYKHKEKRLFGAGRFVSAAHPAGEFSYNNLAYAYAPENVKDGKSTVNEYQKNTWFIAAINNLKGYDTKELRQFAEYSESDFPAGVSLPPLFAMEWEALGGSCAYAHIAKGSTSIRHYFTLEMGERYKEKMAEFNRENGTEFDPDLHLDPNYRGASKYFEEKTLDFFSEAQEKFAGEDLSERIFVWLQGESDWKYSAQEYRLMLNVLWEKLKTLGFTRFFMLRVDFFGEPALVNVMRAQEQFCDENKDCYMMSRMLSFISIPDEKMREINAALPRELDDCRDCFYGFSNWHINEKGFSLAAKKMAANAYRILRENLPPELEDELVPGI